MWSWWWDISDLDLEGNSRVAEADLNRLMKTESVNRKAVQSGVLTLLALQQTVVAPHVSPPSVYSVSVLVQRPCTYRYAKLTHGLAARVFAFAVGVAAVW